MSSPSRPPRLAPAATPIITLRDIAAHCSNCTVRELCLPVGVDEAGVRQIDALVTERLKLKKGDKLYRAGDPFDALHAIRVGSCKTTVFSAAGHQQVAGYHMIGDIVGMDGIGTERHGAQAVALEDTEVCVLRFDRLEELSRHVAPLQRNLHKVLSIEIAREQNVMLLLGSMDAEERLAVFLLNLSERYKERGYSATEFVLRLTREDIGSYLGLKLETVSRLLSRFQVAKLIQIQGRLVKLLDVPAIMRIAGRRR
jgi:CRP/FNR family transcriptional regulator, anaerobic regulatory protein